MTDPTTSALRRIRTNAAFAGALAASVVTLAATLFATNQRDLTFVIPATETFARAFGLASLPVLIYLVVLIGAGMLGWLRVWWQGLAAAAVGVFLGGVLGFLIQAVTAGAALNGEAWGAIFGELLGLNFPFVVAGLLAGAFVAPMVYRPLAGEGAPGMPANYVGGFAAPVSTDAAGAAFVRIPSEAMLDAAADDDTREAMNTQWEALVAAFEQYGWGTQAIPEAPHSPDAVFVGDMALVIGEQVIPARPRDDSRRAELGAVREALLGAGAVIDELEAPAAFDPADVVVSADTVFVGVGAGTNDSAIRQLRRLVVPRGYRVVAVPMIAKTRLCEACSVLPDGTLLAWAEAIAHPEVLGGFIAVPEPRGAAVLALNEYTLAVSAAAVETAAVLSSLGYEVVPLELSALETANGVLTRLSLRSRD